MDAGNNIENNRNNNDLDALEIRPERRDPFPKADLKGGFIGDRYPLCSDVDASLGSFKYVGPIGDAPLLAADDALYEALCAEVDGACTFPASAAVPPGAGVQMTVVIEETRRRGRRAVYEFVPPACVRMAFSNDAASVKVQVQPTGAVSVVHEPTTAWELSLDSQRLFRVPWAGDHPTSDGAGCGADCSVSGISCLCYISTSTTAAFDSIPTREAALATLHIGSPVGDPSASYAVYGESDGVTAYSKTGALDADAIFAVENEIGVTIFLANKVATVSVGGGAYSFRNAPHFLPLAGGGTEGEAAAETQALIDMCFAHPNAAPFFAKLMIQRLVTSNPSPRYVKAVVEAFRSGSYGSFGSGAYGDIGATVAARTRAYIPFTPSTRRP